MNKLSNESFERLVEGKLNTLRKIYEAQGYNLVAVQLIVEQEPQLEAEALLENFLMN